MLDIRDSHESKRDRVDGAPENSVGWRISQVDTLMADVH